LSNCLIFISQLLNLLSKYESEYFQPFIFDACSSQRFFEEMTEACFGSNDFYPFNQGELAGNL